MRYEHHTGPLRGCGIREGFLMLCMLLAASVAMAQADSLKGGSRLHPDSLAADSLAMRQSAAAQIVVPLALPSPPDISYTVPPVLQVGVPVSFSPVNTGGAVYADGDVTTFAGSGAAGSTNGTGTAATFYYPSGIVPDGSGNVYVSDYRNNRIRKITPAGVVTTFAGSGVAGTGNGTGTAAQFNGPNGIAIDGSGNLYVADRASHRIRKITPSGVVTTLAGSTQGSSNGTGSSAQFNTPTDVAVDGSGNVYVTEDAGQRIRKITPSGVVTTLAGSGSQGSTDGTGTSASFNYPGGLTIDGSGNLYVADQLNSRIRKVTPSGVVTTFATGVTRPVSLERDGTGDLYAGLFGNRLMRISPSGVVTVAAGTGSAGSDNGPPLSASFSFPGGVHFYPQGTVYIADQQNNRIRRMGTGQGYSVSPSLPAGLTLNRTTGVISGTPTSVTASGTYTVTGYNAGGTDTYGVTFSVVPGTFSADRNYILKRVYLAPFTSVPGSPAVDQAMQDITYYDGLGRVEQEIGIRAVPSKTKDVVTPVAYDGYGREEYRYLPYATATGAGGGFKANSVTSQGSYYSSSGTVPAGQTATAYARSRRVFESSPLNRVLEQGFPGQAWQPSTSRTAATGHTAVTEYTTNNATAFGTVATTRMVSRYGVTLSTAGVATLTLNGTYGAGELYVTVLRDEDWNGQTGTFAGRLHTTEEYRDKQGRVVLERRFNGTNELLSTYYVYNDLGQLSFVLTPELGGDRTGTVAPTAAELNNFAYQYRYDGRGRLQGKKLPGVEWEFFVYNRLDGVAMSQNGRQRSELDGNGKQYMGFTKYDGQGRAVIRGIERGHDGGSSPDYAAIYSQGIIDGAANQWEERSTATGNLHGYTNRSIPWGDNPANPTVFDILEVNYYDRYEGIPGLPDNQSGSHSKLVQGKLVASKAKVLGTSDTYLWTVYYYDDKGNVTETYSQHYKGGTVTGNYDRTTSTYTFTGQVKLVSRKHFVGGVQQVQVNTDHVYDHRDRLLDTWMQVNTAGIPTHISRNHYNEVGQVWKKEHNGTDGVTLNYATAYTYNERGWLRTSGGTLFSEELQYNTGVTKYYGGNIAYQVFSRKHPTGASVSGTYSYTYDGLNRLVTGTMAESRGREILTYDRNGNIRTLRRTSELGVTVDSLLYGYEGNRVTTVNDRSTNAAAGFMLRGVTTYTPDANGNITKRLNGTSPGDDITNTVYNYLNLPQTVTASGATVTYTYDGRGRKLRSVNGINGQTRDYVDGIEYYNGTLELIGMPEGRILKSGTIYKYEYMLKDHLGNARSSFTGSAGTTATFGMDYYPFGLQYPGNMATGSPKNNYLYNGKELQDRLKLYDYGARLYDPVIGRWNAVDGLAENHHGFSPYAYVLNNPMAFIDPLGLDTLGVHELNMKTYKEGVDVVRLDEVSVNMGERRRSAAFETEYASVRESYRIGTGGLFMGYPDNLIDRANERFYEKYYQGNEVDPFTGRAISGSGALVDANWIIDLGVGGLTGGLRTLAARGAAMTGGHVFWSGGGVAKNAAMDFAKANGMKTLEMTTGGRIMNSIGPYLPRSVSGPIWDGLSRNFAKGASGSINVFQNAAGVSLNSTWRRIEYPILQNNNIFYHIVK